MYDLAIDEKPPARKCGLSKVYRIMKGDAYWTG